MRQFAGSPASLGQTRAVPWPPVAVFALWCGQGGERAPQDGRRPCGDAQPLLGAAVRGPEAEGAAQCTLGRGLWPRVSLAPVTAGAAAREGE